MDVRTDLALELRDRAVKNSKKKIDGIDCYTCREHDCEINKILIKNKTGAKLIGRPMGRYITFEFGRVGVADTEKFTDICEIIVKELTEMIENKCPVFPKRVLVACLGNADISADALGPLTSKSIIVTSHLKTVCPSLFESFGNVELMSLSLGVMAQTGLESAEIIKSVAQSVKPDIIIAVDALASSELSRLACTLQISDTGISPGSGIGNFRNSLNESSLGLPVFSIGVPTMVEISSLVSNALKLLEIEPRKDLVSALGKNGKLLVTPKDCAIIIADLAKLIGFAINKTFIKDLDYEEIARLVN